MVRVAVIIAITFLAAEEWTHAGLLCTRKLLFSLVNNSNRWIYGR